MLQEFAAQNDTQTLLISKTGSENDGDDDNTSPSTQVTFSFESEAKRSGDVGVRVGLIKVPGLLSASTPIANQVFLCQINDNAPFQSILSYVRHCFLPYSRSLIGTQDEKKEDRNVIRSVINKLGELEVELLRSQLITEIPKVTLDSHPVIRQYLEECAASGKTPTTDGLPNGSDSSFLNEVQKYVSTWRKSILSVTSLNHDLSTGTTIDEISFWSQMQNRIDDIQNQLAAPMIEFTFKVLSDNTRHLPVMSFHADNGVKGAKERTALHNALLRDFPIRKMLASSDVNQLVTAVHEIFLHLKSIRTTEYPPARAEKLVLIIGNDVSMQLRSILNARPMMDLEHREFQRVVKGAMALFRTWNDDTKDFTSTLMTHSRKIGVRTGTRTTQSVDIHSTDLHELKERIIEMRTKRDNHQRMHDTIARTLTADSEVRNLALSALLSSKKILEREDCLDVTPSGRAVWNNAIAQYNKSVEQVQREIADIIRDLLEQAKGDPYEMFRVCQRFSELFEFEHIQSVVRDYQDALIGTVKRDITALQEKFKAEYEQSEARRMSGLHDLPPVSGTIIWMKQIKRQLNVLMERVANVLGKNWSNQLEGKHVKKEHEQFQKKLDHKLVVNQWLQSVKLIDAFHMEDNIFRVETNLNQVSLQVNFDKRLITLFKEVRALRRMKAKIPPEIQTTAMDARDIFPFAVRLEEILRIYMRTCQTLDDRRQLQPLAAGYKKAVQTRLQKGITLNWDAAKLGKFVDALGHKVVEFQEQVEELSTSYDIVNILMRQLSNCKPTRSNFREILDNIQAIIDRFDKAGFTNLGNWVTFLDNQVEGILVDRLHEILRLWVDALEIMPGTGHGKRKAVTDSGSDDDDDVDSAEKAAAKAAADAAEAAIKKQLGDGDEKYVSVLDFVLAEPVRHEITMRNQVLQVHPPLEDARLALTKDLMRRMGVVLELPRLRCFWTNNASISTQDNKAQSLSDAEKTFRSVLSKIKNEDLQQCFDRIESKISLARTYLNSWLQYQALWDMNMDSVAQELGNNVRAWESVLLDMKKARATFDNSDRERIFGPILVHYQSVQQKVNDKYDNWHKLVLSRFGQKVDEIRSGLYKSLMNARKQLETANLDFGSTEEIVESVTLLQDLRHKSTDWRKNIEDQKSVEKLLERQRFMFPDEWLYLDRVQSEYYAFDQILNRKLAQMHNEAAHIQAQLNAEEVRLNDCVKQTVSDWKSQRPVQGDLDHLQVTHTLDVFNTRVKKIDDEIERLNRAKRALEMTIKHEDRLDPVREELGNLREVWSELSKSWKALDQLHDALFSELQASELRKRLTKIQNNLAQLSNHVRSYGAYGNLRDSIQKYLEMNGPMNDLTSKVLRPKHHKQLLKEIGITDVMWSDLTVGRLWQADLNARRKTITAIIEQAMGEAALEEFLNELIGIWEHMRMELVDYRGKCFLIRNWDPMFSQLADHISDLGSMRQSPYYSAFEHDASQWEDRLNHAQTIFDMFIEVQRRWVYLEGIFNNSADVQQQLVYQFKRFRNFDREFVRLMREIKRDPSVLFWIKPDQGLAARLEQYQETLNGIQKALADYLERQRAAFPRFYFVGDEDLLEIIGNAKNPLKIMRHMTKMFAGIAALSLSENGQHIYGMISREGEEVKFVEPVGVADTGSVQDWLAKVEQQMRLSLATLLETSVSSIAKIRNATDLDADAYFQWIDSYPAQIVALATQVNWSETIDRLLAGGKPSEVEGEAVRIDRNIVALADRILEPDISVRQRRQYEQLVTEMVHQRDVTRELVAKKVASNQSYDWLRYTRFYFNPAQKNVLERVQMRVSRASFWYGFEYLGASEKLVQTPLTDRVYLTMSEALHMRMGGNPYGPAGTGKTETIKALGSLLGRFVLVFNCDENFDFNAMGRIFIGLCQCGAWGCFDEFNRLEERILSAVSQQIQTIQMGLREDEKEIELLNRHVALNPQMGIFVTMNPGYAGRSNLPDNLKQLFRGIAMMKADRRLIAEVMLFSQGFRTAEHLSGKIGLLFSLCADQLSRQAHYDWGLRALKSVLRSAGTLKRKELSGESQPDSFSALGDSKGDAESSALVASDQKDATWWREHEQELLVRSVCETIVPKLVARDASLFGTLLRAVFPSAEVVAPEMNRLRKEIDSLCNDHHYLAEPVWVDKVCQLAQIQAIHHGVIMVGPSGTGKSAAWRVLSEALEKIDGKKTEFYTIDPKALSKEELYGTLDPTTLEWTDGVFTFILRKIIDNVRGESLKRHWIVFDGDVDPEWAENLNSVLDDNKLLTLPNGERLALTSNIRVMFEVKDLKHATPATVSRCGMIWFSDEVVSQRMLFHYHLEHLRNDNIDALPQGAYNRWKQVQQNAVDLLKPYFGFEGKTDSVSSSFVSQALATAMTHNHVMKRIPLRFISSMFATLKAGLVKAIDYDDNHPDFPLSEEQLAAFMSKYLVYATIWGFGGSLSLADRIKFCDEVTGLVPSTIEMPSAHNESLLDYEVRIDVQNWELWESRIDMLDIEPHKIVSPELVIDTVDTARHADVVSSWLHDHRPLIMCGPPGSGKSMTLTAVLRSLPQFELVTLNFASSTTPEMLLSTFDHYCKVDRTPNGLVMRPAMKNKWLVIFCDEINLPSDDLYETQHVITFIRQLVEYGGFWRAADLCWVKCERIQIIGACNPPTDAGRVVMTERFLRWVPLLFVDFPAPPSLRQIYGTFSRALLKLTPNLRTYGESLTGAMIDVYLASQERFTPDVQPHYIYSPRELSRWVRAMYEAMKPVESMTLEQLVRLWLHEALRLFQDRLVDDAEREWTDNLVDSVARKHFKTVDESTALARPVLYSNWLSKQYESVNQEELREHVKQRLYVFNEEELDVKLVIFDEVLDHILRIDRVLRQPLGHVLLVGASGSGKTILSKFVSWMNGMSVFQIKMHRGYAAKEFDRDLRLVLTRAGTKNEKICFIFDESNVLNTAFLERMNALLASGEVPGLFDGADFKQLMLDCKESARRDGVMIDAEEELYSRFCTQVQRNLHVVFTMNPLNDDFHNRSATSPALFNRCVIDWFGEWSHTALEQVGFEFTRSLDLGDATNVQYDKKSLGMLAPPPGSQREYVVSTMVFVHESVHEATIALGKQRAGRTVYVTPRHYLDFIKHYHSLFNQKHEQLQDQQRHLRKGLRQLQETEAHVLELRTKLNEQKVQLNQKNEQANEKLSQMLENQRIAQQKRDQSIKKAEEVAVSEEKVKARRAEVTAELASAEPALRSAEQSVRGIKKAQLDELASYSDPPPAVKMTVEPLMILLNEDIDKWGVTRRVLRRNDFIPRILEYKSETITEQMRKRIKKEYTEKKEFSYEKINRASRACGPLVHWLTSQLSYAEILNKVEPLQNETKALAAKADKLRNESEELKEMVAESEQKIEEYKTEYAHLISEAEQIRAQMDTVKHKVDRSVNLLKNLGVEKERWESDAKGFQEQMGTVVGDCLVAAAFLAYIGYFNKSYREMLVDKWIKELRDNKVPLKDDLAVTEYLSLASERLEWQSHNLPRDDLCTENAIMLRSFNRYPLIIDPSGQATEFLMSYYKDRKIIRTSFLDDSFLKALESALRFGNALLVEDVENMDPILNPVLNREIFKNAGRVMVTLGDKEIDFSPSFVIFLSTRNPNAHFTPDLCSRVTIVNFTITHSSLTSQCLSKVLKSERPDVDEKRTDQLRLQGEFRVRLRQLEDNVLSALNSVQGNILDDDKVMTSLETLKTEAAEVRSKAAESDDVMEQIVTESNKYLPFALACSRFYFTLEQLGDVHFLYQFSLRFFLDIVDTVLVSPKLAETKDADLRLRILTKQLFWIGHERMQRTLLHRDSAAASLRLLQLFLMESEHSLDPQDISFFMRGKVDGIPAEDAGAPAKLNLTKAQQLELGVMFQMSNFQSLEQNMNDNSAAWEKFLDTKFALESRQQRSARDATKAFEDGKLDASVFHMPTGWEKSRNPTEQVFHYMAVCRVLRPDLLPELANVMMAAEFGEGFVHSADSADLQHIVTDEIDSRTPLLLCSLPGFDASGHVDALAFANNKRQGQGYFSFAMGSPDGYSKADEAIRRASKAGMWVLLKNVHLSPAWLNRLEKTLHLTVPHDNFRLFMTMELNDRVPVNLLRMSHIIVYEPPIGLKSSLQRSFGSLSSARVDAGPTERSRMYFLLAWLHAVILERLRYVPVGWSKGFEFGQVDFQNAVDALDEWIDRVARGRANVKPSELPWQAIQALCESIIYGGRVDNPFDQQRLEAFVHELFSEKSFGLNFALCSTVSGASGSEKLSPLLTMPDVNNYDGFHKWIESLPDTTTPEMLGLPKNAEIMLLMRQGRHIMSELLALQDQGTTSEAVAVRRSSGARRMSSISFATDSKDAGARPAWMVQMCHQMEGWMKRIPAGLPSLERSHSKMNDPLFRTIEREHNTWSQLLSTVLGDLRHAVQILGGKGRADNNMRGIFKSVQRDQIPRRWAQYPIVEPMPVGAWIEDFSMRIEMMAKMVNTISKSSSEFRATRWWLGGLSSPEAFVAATRQSVAQQNSWSLEELELHITMQGDADFKQGKNSFLLDGLTLFGSGWANGQLTVTDDMQAALPTACFEWKHVPADSKNAGASADDIVSLPVYLNQSRKPFLFSVNLKCPTAIPKFVWSERGACITAWTPK
jgi:dynein cytoplasmic 1 heavy chain